MAGKEQPTVNVVETHRLTAAAYRELESKLPQPTNPTDGIAAAYNLGIQRVLGILRNGFVVEG